MSISTDAIPPDDRFEAWRDRYIGVNEVIVPREGREGFAAAAEDWPLGELLLSRAAAPARRLVRTARHCAADGFDHWVLRVSRVAPMVCRVGERGARIAPGQLFVGSFAEPTTIEFGDGPWVAVIMPRHVVRRWGIDLDAAPRPAPQGAMAGLLADFLLATADRLPELTAAEVPRLVDALRALLAVCLPAADAAPAVAPEDLAAGQRAAAEMILRREIGSARLDVARLAALSGVSRSTLYRLYEAEGGVAARIRQLRLEKVHAALADPAQSGRPIHEVAGQWGLHCIASFNRSFRSAYGVTPGAVRASAKRLTRPATSDFETWLREA